MAEQTAPAPNQGATGEGPETGSESGYTPSGGGDDPFGGHPELFVAGAFAGGFALAMLLRRLGS